jgi:hypothetical protein
MPPVERLKFVPPWVKVPQIIVILAAFQVVKALNIQIILVPLFAGAADNRREIVKMDR